MSGRLEVPGSSEEVVYLSLLELCTGLESLEM